MNKLIEIICLVTEFIVHIRYILLSLLNTVIVNWAGNLSVFESNIIFWIGLISLYIQHIWAWLDRHGL